jgi:hypothetical protein
MKIRVPIIVGIHSSKANQDINVYKPLLIEIVTSNDPLAISWACLDYSSSSKNTW